MLYRWFIHGKVVAVHSYYSIYRDGADMPISLTAPKHGCYKLFQTNSLLCKSFSIHYNTLKVHKIHRYSDSWKFVKLFIILFFLFKRPTVKLALVSSAQPGQYDPQG